MATAETVTIAADASVRGRARSHEKDFTAAVSPPVEIACVERSSISRPCLGAGWGESPIELLSQGAASRRRTRRYGTAGRGGHRLSDDDHRERRDPLPQRRRAAAAVPRGARAPDPAGGR